MKKIVVNDSCIGCGACIAIDSEHFDFNDEGLSVAISNENLESDELQNAISSCPVNAIKLTEAEEGNAKCKCGDDCPCGDECDCGEDCDCGETCECGEGCDCAEDCKCEAKEEKEKDND